MPASRISCSSLSENFYKEMYKFSYMEDCEFFISTEREYPVHVNFPGETLKFKIITEKALTTQLMFDILSGNNSMDVEYVEHSIDETTESVILAYIKLLHSKFIEMQTLDEAQFMEDMLSESFSAFLHD